jgi:hypothetical protein
MVSLIQQSVAHLRKHTISAADRTALNSSIRTIM